MLDVGPARNALKLVRGKFNNLVYNSMIVLTQRVHFHLLSTKLCFVFYEKTCKKWLFFSLRDHFSGVKT